MPYYTGFHLFHFPSLPPFQPRSLARSQSCSIFSVSLFMSLILFWPWTHSLSHFIPQSWSLTQFWSQTTLLILLQSVSLPWSQLHILSVYSWPFCLNHGHSVLIPVSWSVLVSTSPSKSQSFVCFSLALTHTYKVVHSDCHLKWRKPKLYIPYTWFYANRQLQYNSGAVQDKQSDFFISGNCYGMPEYATKIYTYHCRNMHTF